MHPYVLRLGIALFTLSHVSAEAQMNEGANVYSAIDSECAIRSEKLRCERSLQQFWEVRKELTVDERQYLLEKYLSLDVPLRADSKNWKRGIEMLHELAAENPNQAIYPAIEAVNVARLDPLEGIRLAHDVVNRFPDQTDAHTMLALILSLYSEKLIAYHYRRAFELEAASAGNPTAHATGLAVRAIDAIEKTEGSRGVKEFAQYARAQLNWDQWSEQLIGDAQEQLDAKQFDAQMASKLLVSVCVKNTVYLDEGELCDRVVELIYTNLNPNIWEQNPMAESLRQFHDYFDSDTIVTKNDVETSRMLREMASSSD